MIEPAPRPAHASGPIARSAGARPGVLLHKPHLYDLFVELALLDRAPSFREQLLELAQLRPGEILLDVGCGTGSLALLAKKAVGEAGVVCGIDASADMIAWARRKAERCGAEVQFQRAAAQSMPFPEARFDIVLSTLMLHHLAKKARAQLTAEARRVVKPGGRVLVVDFAEASPRKGLTRHLRPRHGSVALPEIVALLEGSGLRLVDSGRVGIQNVHYALATAPCPS